MAISREQVFAVADELQANGQKPTLEAIRQRLGGSYTTLAPLLREWKAAQVAGDVPMSEPVPENIAGRLEDVAAEIWRAALDLANSRLAEEREALEEARAALESERDEAVELADGLAADLDAARAELDAARAELDAARERAQADAVQMAELRGRLAALEPLLSDLRARMATVAA
jgi:multidrug efflux pump subunit AcrA (membrane-fusion protein)